MDQLCEIKEALIQKVYGQIDNFDNICAEELGEVIDIIKDIEQIKYYKVMKEKTEMEMEQSTTTK